MSEQTTDQYDDDGNPIEPTQNQPGGEQRTDAEWATLRREKKARKDAEDRVTKIERERAFEKAGIDPEKMPLAGYFIQGYDGEMTPEAIKAKALEVGLLLPPGQEPEVLAAATAQQRIAQAASGASPATQAGMAALDQAFAEGGRDALYAALREQGIEVKTED